MYKRYSDLSLFEQLETIKHLCIQFNKSIPSIIERIPPHNFMVCVASNGVNCFGFLYNSLPRIPVDEIEKITIHNNRVFEIFNDPHTLRHERVLTVRQLPDKDWVARNKEDINKLMDFPIMNDYRHIICAVVQTNNTRGQRWVDKLGYKLLYTSDNTFVYFYERT